METVAAFDACQWSTPRLYYSVQPSGSELSYEKRFATTENRISAAQNIAAHIHHFTVFNVINSGYKILALSYFIRGTKI
jgi:hypothetical protein